MRRVDDPLDLRVRGIPEGYHALLAPRLLGPWTGELARRLPASAERVLDLACGAGLVASNLPAHARVVGVDAWDEMAQLARRAHPAPRFSWCVGDFHRLPFRSGAFDAVACQQALQFAEEVDAVLGEARRVLRPGGWAGFAVWADLSSSPGFAALHAEVARHWGEAAAPGVAMPFSLDRANALRDALARAGFREVQVERLEKTLAFDSPADFVRRYVAGSYLLELLPDRTPEERRNLVGGVEKALAPWTCGEGLRFPIHAHLATGRAP